MLSTGNLTVGAANDTVVASFAGAVAYASASSEKSSRALGGAFGFNYVGGITEAVIDGVTSLMAGNLDVTATIRLDRRDGGFDRRGHRVERHGGDRIDRCDRHQLFDEDETGEYQRAGPGFRTRAARRLRRYEPDSDRWLGAFGGKGGYGVGVGFVWMSNDTTATVDSLNDFKHTGALDVKAHTDSDIIAATGALGVATGGTGRRGLLLAARSLSPCSTTRSRLKSWTRTRLPAQATSRFGGRRFLPDEFLRRVCRGGSAAYGIAAALNVMQNNVVARVENSTLRTSGSAEVDAKNAGTF